jgi:hypothetical protein
VNANIDVVQEFVHNLLSLIPQQYDEEKILGLLGQLSATVSQKGQFVKVVTGLLTLNAFDEAPINQARSTKQLLIELTSQLQASPVLIDGHQSRLSEAK